MQRHAAFFAVCGKTALPESGSLRFFAVFLYQIQLKMRIKSCFLTEVGIYGGSIIKGRIKHNNKKALKGIAR